MVATIDSISVVSLKHGYYTRAQYHTLTGHWVSKRDYEILRRRKVHDFKYTRIQNVATPDTTGLRFLVKLNSAWGWTGQPTIDNRWGLEYILADGRNSFYTVIQNFDECGQPVMTLGKSIPYLKDADKDMVRKAIAQFCNQVVSI